MHRRQHAVDWRTIYSSYVSHRVNMAAASVGAAVPYAYRSWTPSPGCGVSSHVGASLNCYCSSSSQLPALHLSLTCSELPTPPPPLSCELPLAQHEGSTEDPQARCVRWPAEAIAVATTAAAFALYFASVVVTRLCSAGCCCRAGVEAVFGAGRVRCTPR